MKLFEILAKQQINGRKTILKIRVQSSVVERQFLNSHFIPYKHLEIKGLQIEIEKTLEYFSLHFKNRIILFC
jgi:hypothetical protein